MSKRALALGVVDRLRSAFGDTAGEFVFKSDDLRPPPAACSFQTVPFILTVGSVSVQKGPTNGGDSNDQVYTLQVCVTAWMGYSPWDRQSLDTGGETDQTGFAQDGDVEETTEEGMESVADRVVTYLLEDWTTVQFVNARIPGAGVSTNGFVEPFHNPSIGDVEPAGNQWVHSDGKDDAQGIKKLVVTLSGARRIRIQGTL